MGLALSTLWQNLFRGREYRLLMLGLDAAGKTTVLYKLKVRAIYCNTATAKATALSVSVESLGRDTCTRALEDKGVCRLGLISLSAVF